MSKETLQPQDKYVLRLPDGMRDRLKEIAAFNGRSLNAEIIERLTRSLKAWPQIDLPEPLYERAINAPVGLIMPLEQEINDLVIEIVDRRVPKSSRRDIDLFAEFEKIIAEEPDETARTSMRRGLENIRQAIQERREGSDE